MNLMEFFQFVPGPNLQPIRSICTQIRCQYPSASSRSHRRQQGPHHCRGVQGDARDHLRPGRQRPEQVWLLQALGVPQRRGGERPPRDFHF